MGVSDERTHFESKGSYFDRSRNRYIHRWKLVFIVYTRPSSNSKGSDMPNRL